MSTEQRRRWELLTDAEVLALIDALEVADMELYYVERGIEPYGALYADLLGEAGARGLGSWL